MILDYVFVEQKEKLQLLFTFLVKRQQSRISVKFWTDAERDFVSELLIHMKIDHSLDLNQQNSVLLVNMNTKIDTKQEYIVYFDPPIETTLNDQCDKYLIFLIEHEKVILQKLKDEGYTLNETRFQKNQLSNTVLEMVNKLTQKNYQFYVKSINACKAYLITYTKLKESYDFNQINPYNAANMFGLEVPPKMNNYVLKKNCEYEQPKKIIQTTVKKIRKNVKSPSMKKSQTKK